MQLVRALIAGAVAGAIGAAAWAGISYGTGFEIGWIAWGIGGLVGFAVAWASTGGPVPGLIAVVVSVLSILAGKYAAVYFLFEREIGSEARFVSENMPDLENEELLISIVADSIVDDREAGGERVEWPKGVDPAQAEQQGDYPPAIWTSAEERWSTMTPPDRAAFRDEIEADATTQLGAFYTDLRSRAQSMAFKNSFGAFDIVFLLLAIGTAYKIASSGQVAEGVDV